MKSVGKYEWSENYILSQGYDKQAVDKFFRVDKSLICKIEEQVFTKLTKDKSFDRKCSVFFGQPGAGKSTYMRKNNRFSSYVVLDLDELRKEYPFRDELITLIYENHKTHEHAAENTPGRDFTNFTRKFIGELFDNLFSHCVKLGCNIALQKHASEPEKLENLFKLLNDEGYETELILLIVPGNVSWERCENRNKQNDMLMNTVPKSFHDDYVQKIPKAFTDNILYFMMEKSYVKSTEIVSTNNELKIDKNSKMDYKAIENYLANCLIGK